MTIINRESFDREVFSQVFFSLSADPSFDFIFFTKKLEIMSWILKEIIFLMRRHNLNDETSKKKLSDLLSSPRNIKRDGRPLVEIWVDEAKKSFGVISPAKGDEQEILEKFVSAAVKGLMQKTEAYFDFFIKEHNAFQKENANRRVRPGDSIVKSKSPSKNPGKL